MGVNIVGEEGTLQRFIGDELLRLLLYRLCLYLCSVVMVLLLYTFVLERTLTPSQTITELLADSGNRMIWRELCVVNRPIVQKSIKDFFSTSGHFLSGSLGMLSIQQNGHLIRRSLHLTPNLRYTRYRPDDIFTSGRFHKELPSGRKPTHIIVGAGAAGT